MPSSLGILVRPSLDLLPDCLQLVERLPQRVAHDVAVFIDVDGLEQGAVQAASGLVGGTLVEGLGCVQEAQGESNDLDTDRQLVRLYGKLTGDFRAFQLELTQLGSDLVLWQQVVDGQVHQSGFLSLDLLELLGQIGVGQPGGLLFVGEQLVELAVDLAHEVWVQRKSRVVPVFFASALDNGVTMRSAYSTDGLIFQSCNTSKPLSTASATFAMILTRNFM